jgi:hypothetical protein
MVGKIPVPNMTTCVAAEFLFVHRERVAALPAAHVDAEVVAVSGIFTLTFGPGWPTRTYLTERLQDNIVGQELSQSPANSLQTEIRTQRVSQKRRPRKCRRLSMPQLLGHLENQGPALFPSKLVLLSTWR